MASLKKIPATAGRKRPREALAGELVGLRVKVAASSCKDLLGIEGRVIDETRNTFLVRTSTGAKRVPKAACEFTFPEAGFSAKGKELACRPEDRTKKFAPRR
ncbi:ribonuclease P protein subunit [Candidatus Micrarchaeota archaeon]|nr:ribonuclease P protein subunit [Candidatus Micrarchaeota archaeon]